MDGIEDGTGIFQSENKKLGPNFIGVKDVEESLTGNACHQW